MYGAHYRLTKLSGFVMGAMFHRLPYYEYYNEPVASHAHVKHCDLDSSLTLIFPRDLGIAVEVHRQDSSFGDSLAADIDMTDVSVDHQQRDLVTSGMTGVSSDRLDTTRKWTLDSASGLESCGTHSYLFNTNNNLYFCTQM